MKCAYCGKSVAEDKLFVGLYADIGRWTGGDLEDTYQSELSKYLAVSHFECLAEWDVEQSVPALQKEFAEFRKRAKNMFKQQKEKQPQNRNKRTLLRLLEGGKT